jgi:glycosyltransferase involved in cell wall biosynthesis
MTIQPRVAVLVACHDDGATIRETMDSLRAEPEIELFVVDDGSTDSATRETLAALEREGTRVLHQENAGPSAAWMHGLAATRAPYVMPFSSDDLLVRGATARLAEALDAHPAAAAAWGDLHSFGAASALIPSTPALCPWFLTYVNSLPGIAMFRRELLREAGGWQLRTGIEDWDLWMRLAAGGFAGVYVPGASVLYRRDAGGRFRSRVKRFEPFYDELRKRNRTLFDARPENRRSSPAPSMLKILFPLIERLPLSRLLKVQLCDASSLLFWRAGPRKTARILIQGVLFRLRLLPGAPPPAAPRTGAPHGRAHD